MNIFKNLYNYFILIYSKMIVYLIKLEDKQTRKVYQKREALMNGDNPPLMFKLKNYLSLKFGRKSFSLREQLLFIEAIVIGTKFSNPLQKPLIFTSRRLDVRPYIRNVCKEIAEDIGNISFHASLAKHQALSSNYIALIAVAQKTGDFLQTYEYISRNLRERIAQTSKIKTLLIYPFIVIVMIIGIEMLMALYLAPQIANMYDEDDVLPEIVVSYQTLGRILTEELHILLLILTGIILLIIWFFKLKPTKYLMDILILQIPKVKTLVIQWEISKFFESLNAMAKSESSIKESLYISLPLISNSLIRYSMSIDIQQEAEKTHHLYDILKGNVYIDDKVKNQLKISKETKSSGLEVMESIVEDYKDSMNLLLSAPVALITPILIVVVSVYLFTRLVPLFNALNSYSF